VDFAAWESPTASPTAAQRQGKSGHGSSNE
jgi:hypothetical protein